MTVYWKTSVPLKDPAGVYVIKPDVVFTDSAPSDGKNMVRLDGFGAILDDMLRVHRAVR